MSACSSLPTTVAYYTPVKTYQVHEAVLFSAEDSHDNDIVNRGKTPKWYWDFDFKPEVGFVRGNGVTYPTTAWSYDQPGTYIVAVQYQDDDGQYGNVVFMTVTVGELNRCYYLTDHLGSVKMTVGPGPATMGLVGYWPLEGDGNDESDNGNTASLISYSNLPDIADETIITNVKIREENVAQLYAGASFVSGGKFGKGVQFSNNNGYIDLGNNQNLHPTRISVSAWVKPTQFNLGQNNLVVDGEGGYRLFYNNDGSLCFLVHDDDAVSTLKNGYNEIVYYVPPCITLNTWNHIVATYGFDRKIRIYVNKELIGTSSATIGGDGNINYLFQGDVTVSTSSSSGFNGITGIVDEVKIYNRELVQTEINRDYTHDVAILGYDDYDPWGKQLAGRCLTSSSADDKYKFTGKERDKETNYDYFGARLYDCELGRWLQVDPLADKYPGWSPYNYCMNNPVLNTDPDGRGGPWEIFIDIVVDISKDVAKDAAWDLLTEGKFAPTAKLFGEKIGDAIGHSFLGDCINNKGLNGDTDNRNERDQTANDKKRKEVSDINHNKLIKTVEDMKTEKYKQDQDAQKKQAEYEAKQKKANEKQNKQSNDQQNNTNQQNNNKSHDSGKTWNDN